MKKHRMLVPAVALTAVFLGACGSDGGGGAGFTEQLQTECRSMARGLRSIDAPTQLDEFEQAATDASKVYEDGLTAIKKLEAPDDQSADFKDLQANFQDQVEVFDQIATAAKKDDAATVTTKLTSLSKITEDNVKLADSLDAKPCAFAAVFTAKPVAATTTTKPAPTTTEAPATTAAPTTAAPTTIPPTTAAPPTTASPTTVPATTAAPAEGVKTFTPFADRLTPKGAYSFTDTDAATVTAIRTALNRGPIYAAQSGTISAVDVIDSAGTTIMRVFVFVSDTDELAPGTLAEAENTVSGGAPLTPATFAGVSGKTFPDPSGVTIFVAATGDTLLVAAGVTDAELDEGMTDLVESLPA
jgi:hypothetical protein